MWFALFQALAVDRSQRQVWQYVSTGLVCLVVICTSLALTLLSTSMYRHFTDQKSRIQSVQKQQQSMLDAQNKLSAFDALAQKHPEAFIEYQKHRFDEVFKLETLKDHLANLQKKLKLESLNVQQGAVTPIKNGLYNITVTTDTKVVHDRQFFQLMEHIQKIEMGFCAIKSFDLKRITNKKKTPLFEGRITFQWFVRQA